MEQGQEFVTSNALPEILQKGAKALRQSGELVDFVIVADGKKFAVHKLILAASSDFFRAMFQHPDSIESQNNECHLKDVTAAVLETIIEFCYTSRTCLDMENIHELLMAASILQISALQSLCVEFIVERIDITNCLAFLTLADRCNLPTIIDNTLDLCLDQFEAISRQDEFVRLDASLLISIISHDELFVVEEEKVLSAVMKWIAADKDRACELDNLLDHVRFPLMSARNLIISSREDQIQKSNKFRDLILEASHYHLLQALPEDELRSQMVGKRFRSRCPLRGQQCIFAVGGKNDTCLNTVEKYDPYSNKWLEVKKMTTSRADAGVVILDDCLYVVGGQGNSGSYLSSVECYNIKEDFWRCDVADMKFKRSGLGVCALGGYIYAIGGRNGTDSLDVFERYNPRTNKWQQGPSLRQPRSGAGVTVCSDSIYVVGGKSIDSISSTFVYTVERFDVSNNEWSFVAPTTTSRLYSGCTTLEGKIYAVGGYSISGDSNTGECYDPIEDHWDQIPAMRVKRKLLGLVAMDGLLYAIGGHIGADEHLKLVESYDPVKREWTTKSPMIYARYKMGVASYCPAKRETKSS